MASSATGKEPVLPRTSVDAATAMSELVSGLEDAWAHVTSKMQSAERGSVLQTVSGNTRD